MTLFPSRLQSRFVYEYLSFRQSQGFHGDCNPPRCS